MTTKPMTTKSYTPRGAPVSRALAAYFRSDASLQPDASGVVEHDGRQYVVLEYASEVLAVYRIRTDGVLKRLSRWPKALETQRRPGKDALVEVVLKWLWNEAFYAAGIDEGYAMTAGEPLSADKAIAVARGALLNGDELPVRSLSR